MKPQALAMSLLAVGCATTMGSAPGTSATICLSSCDAFEETVFDVWPTFEPQSIVVYKTNYGWGARRSSATEQAHFGVLVDENGIVQRIDVLSSSGDPETDLENARMLAYIDWTPGQRDGVPIAGWAEFKMSQD